MQAFTDRDIMPFGKHRGKAMANIPAPYLLYLFNVGVDHPGVKGYINANLDVLRAEAAKIKR
ncbi:putative quorum-sensing-regulated virulence factor [Chitinophaga sp. NPDC101104]|uniref:putative quorum-sensing-regulated virulence factor n=1 Tax=Chitinophaga sp. NPDC101104 TaxID=3390561 RepID=UPI003D0065BB